jgi:hypothetical protein
MEEIKHDKQPKVEVQEPDRELKQIKNVQTGQEDRKYISYTKEKLLQLLDNYRGILETDATDIETKNKILEIEQELLYRKNYGG